MEHAGEQSHRRGHSMHAIKPPGVPSTDPLLALKPLYPGAVLEPEVEPELLELEAKEMAPDPDLDAAGMSRSVRTRSHG
jgi:hypothetical protein